MRIGIIAAMDEELTYLESQIEASFYETVDAVDYIIGIYEGHHVYIAKSGVGKVNAAVTTLRLFNEFLVDGIINTGTAGRLLTDIQKGDVVLATGLAYHDVDVTGFGYEYGQLPKMPVVYTPNEAWRLEVEEHLDVVSGIIVTGDQFINTKEDQDAIKERFPEALVCEMESAAVAQTCELIGVPYLIVRSVSDGADDNAAEEFDNFVEITGTESAKQVLKILEHTAK